MLPLILRRAGLVDELFGRFSHDRVAVVVEPVDQRSNRGKLLVLNDGGVVERPQQIAARLKLAQESLVIDVEAERLRGGIEIGAVNEQRKFFFVWGHGLDHQRASMLRMVAKFSGVY